MYHKIYLYSSLCLLSLVIVFAVVFNINISSANRYVAKVNGQEVKLNEFKIYLKIVKKEFERKAGISSPSDIKKMWTEPVEGSDPAERAKQQALDMIINIKLVEQRAKELGIKLTDAEVNLLKEKIKLENTANSFGISEGDFLIFAKSLALREKLANSLTQNIDVSDQEFNQILSQNPNLLKTYLVRQIFFNTSGDNSEGKKSQILKKSETILNRIKQGEDFSKLAQEFSEDSESKNNGGKIEIHQGEYETELENSIFRLKPGGVSGLIKTQNGYYIVKLDNIENLTEAEAERTKKAFRDKIVQVKRKQTINTEFENLKQKAKIEKNENTLKNININQL